VSLRYGLTEIAVGKSFPRQLTSLPGDDYNEDWLFKQMALFGLPDGATRRIVGYVD
jgi:hypothetical protein